MKNQKTMFGDLTEQEEREFRQWAWDNRDKEPSPSYHPVVNEELKIIRGY